MRKVMQQELMLGVLLIYSVQIVMGNDQCFPVVAQQIYALPNHKQDMLDNESIGNSSRNSSKSQSPLSHPLDVDPLGIRQDSNILNNSITFLSDCGTKAPSDCGTKAPSDCGTKAPSDAASVIRSYVSHCSLGEFFDKEGNPIHYPVDLNSPLKRGNGSLHSPLASSVQGSPLNPILHKSSWSVASPKR